MKRKIILALCTTAALQVSAATINVADLGLSSDHPDNTAALKRALEACSGSERNRLVFPKGTYHFHPDFATERDCFISNNDEGLIWRNNQVKKTADYPARESASKPFAITFCDHVEIANKE